MQTSLAPSPHRTVEHSVYAYDQHRKARHISEVSSGKGGYHCIGCGYEMIARKGPIRDNHFSHAPRNFEDKAECTYSDETYRHKLAKEILQRKKEIKVPAVYVFSNDREQAMMLSKPHTVSATTVRNEIQFYEDENGEVKWGRGVNFDTANKKFIIQPDVTFFNRDDNPTLLIELVATHRVGHEKLAKIQRLGLDVVEVIVPKDSPEAIEQVFTVTEATEWLHNTQQADAYTNGIHFSFRNEQGIPPAAEFQRELLLQGETYQCRCFQLRDLIRGLRKCLATERYLNAERAVTGSLSTVAQRRAELKRRVEERRSSCYEKLERAGAGEVGRIEEFIRKERSRYEDLERRYYTKKEELARLEQQREAPIVQRVAELRKLAASRQRKREAEARERRKIERAEASAQADVDRVREQTERMEANIQRAKHGLTRARKDVASEPRTGATVVRGGVNQISEGDSGQHPGLRRCHARADEQRQILMDIAKGQNRIRTLEELKRLLDTGEWKKWADPA